LTFKHAERKKPNFLFSKKHIFDGDKVDTSTREWRSAGDIGDISTILMYTDNFNVVATSPYITTVSPPLVICQKKEKP